MDKNYEYEEEYEEGITFAKLVYFFKKSWLRMVVYIVALCLLVTVIALPVKIFAFTDPAAVVSIEYLYKGADKARAPDGSPLDTDNIISVSVLTEAVRDAGLEKTIKSISELREAMRVESVQSKDYAELVSASKNGDANATEKLRNLYPTQYNIIISEPAELGLSDAQAKKLLNSVVASYFNDFLGRFTGVETIDADEFALSQNEHIEFSDVYDIYSVKLDAIEDYLKILQQEYPNYIYNSENIKYSGFLSELAGIKSKLEMFNSDIISKDIWREPASAKQALIAKKANIEDKLNPLNSYIAKLEDQIENKIKPTTITTTDSQGHTVTTTSYPQDYYEYQKKLDEANRQALAYNTSITTIDRRLNKLEPLPAVNAQVVASKQAELAGYESSVVSLVDRINAAVDSMYKTEFLSKSVKRVQPPVVTREGASFALWLVYVIAAIVGLIVACIVTGVKINAANAAREKVTAKTQTEKKDESDK